MELDHLFICVNHGAPEAELLKDFGLTEGPPNRHPGQGTANRRFFFKNSFIELLYVDNESEIQSDLTKPTTLYDRFSNKEVSPFGIGFRPSSTEEKHAPFPAWNYHPIYLPPELSIEIGKAPITEPFCFFLSFGSRPDSWSEEKQPPFQHQCGFKEITSLRITIPKEETVSEVYAAVASVAGVEIVQGDEHFLEIGFDEKKKNKSHDFRPDLPLKFYW